MDSKLNWKMNSEVVFKKAQSRVFFLRKLTSFGISGLFFMSSIRESWPVLYAVLCWGGCITVDDKNRINKMIRKAGSVIFFYFRFT